MPNFTFFLYITESDWTPSKRCYFDTNWLGFDWHCTSSIFHRNISLCEDIRSFCCRADPRRLGSCSTCHLQWLHL